MEVREQRESRSRARKGEGRGGADGGFIYVRPNLVSGGFPPEPVLDQSPGSDTVPTRYPWVACLIWAQRRSRNGHAARLQPLLVSCTVWSHSYKMAGIDDEGAAQGVVASGNGAIILGAFHV